VEPNLVISVCWDSLAGSIGADVRNDHAELERAYVVPGVFCEASTDFTVPAADEWTIFRVRFAADEEVFMTERDGDEGIPKGKRKIAVAALISDVQQDMGSTGGEKDTVHCSHETCANFNDLHANSSCNRTAVASNAYNLLIRQLLILAFTRLQSFPLDFILDFEISRSVHSLSIDSDFDSPIAILRSPCVPYFVPVRDSI